MLIFETSASLLFSLLLIIRHQPVKAAVGIDPDIASPKRSTSTSQADGQVLGYTTASIPTAAPPTTPYAIISGTRAANPAASSIRAAIKAGNEVGISAGSPNNALADPCGPPVQAADGGISTCHANVSVADTTSQTYYGVHCLNDKTGEVLQQGSCADALYTICQQISGMWGAKYQTTNEWIWSTTGGNCSFGYWLPEGGAPPPSNDRCTDQIMSPINDACKGPTYNVGTVNLRTLPAADALGRTSNGSAVDAGYPSYIMVAQQSHWGVNREDLT